MTNLFASDCPDPGGIGIAAVERDTGLTKDTLRVWERRYGFPTPLRDHSGQRIYSRQDSEKLRLIKRLLDHGYRPGKILPLATDDLLRLADTLHPPLLRREGWHPRPEIEPLLDLLRQHRVEELRRQLGQSLLRLGLASFLSCVIAPFNAAVSDAWTRGRIELFEEHLCAEAMQSILRVAIAGIPRPGSDPPTVLLATLPRETHAVDLLMAEAFFALESCRCISLGPRTPLQEIAHAAGALRADIVFVFFGDSANASLVCHSINELRTTLPVQHEVWVSGITPALERRLPELVTCLHSLSETGGALHRRRRERSSTTTHASTDGCT